MGWDIVTVGKHNLDTSSLEALAKDLNKRLNINIIATCSLDYDYIEETNTIVSCEEKVVQVCNIHNRPSARVFTLTYYDDYFYGAYYWSEKLGDKINTVNFADDELKSSFFNALFSFDKTSFCADYVPRRFRKEMVMNDIYIHNRTISLHFSYPCRWYNFTLLFTKRSWDDENVELPKIRRMHKKYYQKLGCNMIYMFPDQGDASLIEDHLEEPWDNLVEYISSKKYLEECGTRSCFNDDSYIHFDISDFVRNKRPLFEDNSGLTVMTDDFSYIDMR